MKTMIRDYQVQIGTHDLYDVIINDRHEIKTLVTHHPGNVISWIDDIESQNLNRLTRLIVGLDIEWCPEFMGDSDSDHSVATLQLCVGNSCLIFQILQAPNIPRRLRNFLADDDYLFVGAGIRNDINRLRDDYGLEVARSRDLRSWAANELKKQELRGVGLKRLVQDVLGMEIAKPDNVRLSRWDYRFLSNAQVMYACLDAYFSFEIGRRLSAWY